MGHCNHLGRGYMEGIKQVTHSWFYPIVIVLMGVSSLFGMGGNTTLLSVAMAILFVAWEIEKLRKGDKE